MNDYGIRIVGVGWLKYYDPDAGGGVGMISATTDPAEALRFPDKASAWACWQQQSTVRPLRADGTPNQPLTFYTVSIERLDARKEVQCDPIESPAVL